MTFRWLKRYMPRSLYGRAALILILPVVTLQLVVSVVFIQRHFEGVTEQMSRGVAQELRFMLGEMAQQPDQSAALAQVTQIAGALAYDVHFVPETDVPEMGARRWYDFSGLVVIRTLDERLAGLRVVDLPDDRNISVFLNTLMGPVQIDFARSRVSASNPHQLLVNMVFFGVLMTVIAYIYLRNQLRPVARLGRVAEAFGRGQTLPYHPSGAIEVRAAGNAFLDMRARIERQIEQRTMMLSGVSHDLRTPLTRLKLGLAFLPEDERAPLEGDVQEMQRLLDEFLNFARGSAEGEQKPVDPVDIARQVVRDALRTGGQVRLIEAQQMAPVTLNSLSIKRALENLISNALRYGTRAEVSVIRSDKAVIYRVEDDGPGLPESSYGAAVKPFVRLDPARNQNKGSGVGLGLAITNDIARAHGGALRFSKSARLGGLCADIVIGR